MAKITVLSADPTGQADIAPSANPGALTGFGFTDLLGSKIGLKNQTFYADFNENLTQNLIPITMAAQDGGEIVIDYNPLSTGHPIENFNGGLSLHLNGISGASVAGYGLDFDNNGFAPTLTVAGIRALYHAPVLPGINRLRAAYRCISAGIGMDCRYEIRDLANGLALLDSGGALADGRYPNYSGLPAAGIAALSGFYPSWGPITVSKWDNTGPLLVVDPPYADWRSKTVIRVVHQVAFGGTGSYTYQHYYRVGTSGAFTAVGTSGGDTGTSVTLRKGGLTPGNVHQFYRTVSDGVTTLTSATVTASTAAPGALSYVPLYIGDSITEGPGVPTGPYDRSRAIATALAGATPSVESRGLNFGQGNTTSSSAEAFTTALRTLCADLQPDAVDCAFGTNDANSAFSQQTYHDHLDVLAAGLAADGVRLVMHAPIFNQNAAGGTITLLSTSYPAAIAQIVAARPATCFMGDQAAYADFQANVATWFASGDIHPNALGYSAGLGPDHAARIRTLLTQWYGSPPVTISGTGSLIARGGGTVGTPSGHRKRRGILVGGQL